MKGQHAKQPALRVAADDLPRPLTFFLTERERREVVKTLGRRHKDRARALMQAVRRRKRGTLK